MMDEVNVSHLFTGSDEAEKMSTLMPGGGEPFEHREASAGLFEMEDMARQALTASPSVEALIAENRKLQGRINSMEAANRRSAELEAEGYKALHYSDEMARIDKLEAENAALKARVGEAYENAAQIAEGFDAWPQEGADIARAIRLFAALQKDDSNG